jgi:protein SCO1/2
MTRHWSIGSGILAALLWIAADVPAQTSQAGFEPGHSSASGASSYHGGMISPLLRKPEFTLTDTSGRPFDFLAKTQGYVTLLMFGYAHCPDVCPVQMQLIASAIKKLPASAAGQVKVVFVTTDPDLDTPPVLRTFLDHFDTRFVGLTGKQDAIAAAQLAAGVPVAQKTGVERDGVGEVGHTAFVLAYTKDNLAHVIYPDGVTEEDWVHDLPQLAVETWGKP